MLNIQSIEEIILSHIDQIRKYSVISLALFGSYARNEQGESSDIDFLINLEKNTFRNYIDLRNYLETLFHKKIDLVCENSLKEMIKPYILREAKWLVN